MSNDLGHLQKSAPSCANLSSLWYTVNMMATCTVPGWTIRSENLNWVKSERRFHADASTLCMLPGMPAPRRLEVVSHRTGAVAYYEIHDRTECEGDVVRWNYRPVVGDTNAQTTLGMVIWNT